MVLTCQQMRDAEEAAFARGVSAGALMDEAGEGIARALQQFFPKPAHVVLYLGKGNNAGDALVAARHLAGAGWQFHARLASDVADFKELPAAHWKSLGDRVRVLAGADEVNALRGNMVLIDGLVGIGVTGALQGSLRDAVREINALRRTRHAFVAALDLPSGLDSTTGVPGDPCVEADLTITVAQVKDILLADAATDHVGRLAVVPLRELANAKGDASKLALTTAVLLPRLPRRSFDFHKGQAGRVGIVAGSRGLTGAAALCALGALRGGAGLITLFVKEDAYPVIAALTPPEVMVKSVRDYREVLQENVDVIAAGPGLGFQHQAEVLDLIAQSTKPSVIDADALNMLARDGLASLKAVTAPRLLTPHPGEMARLIEREPALKKDDRAATARAFVKRFPQVTLLLKGSRTVIAADAAPLSYNTTGHPGMATGGMGDLLTGLCAALAAQGASLRDAACLGAWLSGRAAELALRDGGYSQESMAATDVAAHLGAAFGDLRALAY